MKLPPPWVPCGFVPVPRHLRQPQRLTALAVEQLSTHERITAHMTAGGRNPLFEKDVQLGNLAVKKGFVTEVALAPKRRNSLLKG